jgi:hypothetical protein
MNYLSRRSLIQCTLCLITLVGLLGNAFAEINKTAGIPDAEAESFFNKVKVANATRDAQAMAKLAAFPLTVDGKKSIKNASAFIARYSEIFNADVVKAVEEQKFETLFSNYQGVMFGNGQLWFAAVCDQRTCKKHKVRIVAINSKGVPK